MWFGEVIIMGVVRGLIKALIRRDKSIEDVFREKTCTYALLVSILARSVGSKGKIVTNGFRALHGP